MIELCLYLCIPAVSTGQPVIVTDSLHQLDGHTGRVTCLSWSLHRDGLLATASYDWLSLVRCVYGGCELMSLCCIQHSVTALVTMVMGKIDSNQFARPNRFVLTRLANQMGNFSIHLL